MPTESNSRPEIELFRQLSTILGLPKNVTKLSLHFEPLQPLVAEVLFHPDVSSEMVVEKRFTCQLTELHEAPALDIDVGVA